MMEKEGGRGVFGAKFTPDWDVSVNGNSMTNAIVATKVMDSSLL